MNVLIVCIARNLFNPTQPKTNNLFWLDETALNNVLLPTLFKVVNNIVQHCYTLLQASSGSTTCSVLLTTLNNVGSKILSNAVFIRPEQIVRFWLCTSSKKYHPFVFLMWINHMLHSCSNSAISAKILKYMP